MQSNTIPAGYTRKATLTLPQTFRNNEMSPWALPFVISGFVIVPLMGFAHDFDFSINTHLLTVLVLAFALLYLPAWIFTLIKLTFIPLQEICISPESISVRSRLLRGKATIFPRDTLECITLYSDRSRSQFVSPLDFQNTDLLSSFMWMILGLFLLVDKTKIAIHTKSGIILFDVPVKKLAPIMNDLGILLNIPVKS